MGTINRHSPGCQCCGPTPCDPCDPCCEDKALLCYTTVDYSDDITSATLDPVESEVDPNCALVFIWARYQDVYGNPSSDLTYSTTGVDYINCPPFGLNPITGQSITDAFIGVAVIVGWDAENCVYRAFVRTSLDTNSSATSDCTFSDFPQCGASSHADHDSGVNYTDDPGQIIDCDNPVISGTLTCEDPSTASLCGLPASLSYTLTFS